MSRLVDVDELKHELKWLEEYDPPVYHDVASTIDEMPTVEVVAKSETTTEVVRCKDCLYRVGSACDYSAVYVRPNGYCQWGRRKEDETD